MIAMIEKQRKQMYSDMDSFIAKKQKRKQEQFKNSSFALRVWSSEFQSSDHFLEVH